MKRCSWCNENNPLYVAYHDQEWGVRRMDDAYLFEMLLLESFSGRSLLGMCAQQTKCVSAGIR